MVKIHIEEYYITFTTVQFS